MINMRSLIAITLLVGCTLGLRFDGPLATVVLGEADFSGWTPRPTSGALSAREIFGASAGDICGFVEGKSLATLTCPLSWTCSFNDELKQFGCCHGTALSDCGFATSCLDSTAVPACASGSACSKDEGVQQCSGSWAPYCAAYRQVLNGKTYSGLGCAKSSGQTLDVFPTPTPAASTTISADTSSTSTSTSSSKTTSSGIATDTHSPNATQSGSATTTKIGALTPTPKPEAGAMRTAEAMLGVAGLAGVFAFLL